MRDDDRLGFGEYWLYLDMKEDFSGRKPCDEDPAVAELIQKGLKRMYQVHMLSYTDGAYTGDYTAHWFAAASDVDQYSKEADRIVVTVAIPYAEEGNKSAMENIVNVAQETLSGEFPEAFVHFWLLKLGETEKIAKWYVNAAISSSDYPTLVMYLKLAGKEHPLYDRLPLFQKMAEAQLAVCSDYKTRVTPPIAHRTSILPQLYELRQAFYEKRMAEYQLKRKQWELLSNHMPSQYEYDYYKATRKIKKARKPGLAKSKKKYDALRLEILNQIGVIGDRADRVWAQAETFPDRTQIEQCEAKIKACWNRIFGEKNNDLEPTELIAQRLYYISTLMDVDDLDEVLRIYRHEAKGVDYSADGKFSMPDWLDRATGTYSESVENTLSMLRGLRTLSDLHKFNWKDFSDPRRMLNSVSDSMDIPEEASVAIICSAILLLKERAKRNCDATTAYCLFHAYDLLGSEGNAVEWGKRAEKLEHPWMMYEVARNPRRFYPHGRAIDVNPEYLAKKALAAGVSEAGPLLEMLEQESENKAFLREMECQERERALSIKNQERERQLDMMERVTNAFLYNEMLTDSERRLLGHTSASEDFTNVLFRDTVKSYLEE